MLGFNNSVPLPMILDLHGWTGSAYAQMTESGWAQVASTYENIVLVWPNGMGDGPSSMNSWNCSMTNGPLGPTCDTDRANVGIDPYECYYSCPLCDEM